MKILIVGKLYSPWIGGVEQIMQQLAEGISASKKFDVEILCCQSKGKTAVDEIHSVSVTRAGSMGMLLSMPISFSFFNIFRKKSSTSDVINIHHPFPLASVAYWLFRPKGRLIIHYHSAIIRQKITGAILKPFTIFMLKRAEKIIVSSPGLKKNTRELARFQDKTVVVPFGIDIDGLHGAINSEEVLSLQKKYGDFVLFVGRLSYYKGVQYLIDAMQNIDKNLVIIGEGNQKELLEQKVRELGLEKRVFFLPHQSLKKLYNYYKAATVFVLPSIYPTETFGLVLLYALGVGTPAISTELGTGTSYVNKDGVSGIVVSPQDVDALTAALEKILADEELRDMYASGAERRIEKKFNEVKMISCFEDILLNKK